ncbi:mixed lineage kinase domain-like protein [Polymixia lowei]
MEFVEPILGVVQAIFKLAQEVKANKKRCLRLAKRVSALGELVQKISDRGPDNITPDVENSLNELTVTLNLGKCLVKKYTTSNFLKRMVIAHDGGEEFGCLYDCLTETYQVLSLALQVEQGSKLHQIFELTSQQAEDEADRKEDIVDLHKLLRDWMKSMDEKTDATHDQIQNLTQVIGTFIQTINKPSMTYEDIREIKSNELVYDSEPFMKTSTSELYKGEYKKFTVAIKRFHSLNNAAPSEVRRVFQREVDTMKRFESPNILRMFGICIQDQKASPDFLIIMEYCEKGSLRQVLDSTCKLSWARKARMCLDAAKGLCRLHHTEEKSKVHGSINSSKFLVAEGYRVKLGGLELAKTETSLRRTETPVTCALSYCSPQQLDSIHQPYNMECEMYSFGIVLWEIATRKNPFEGCSVQDIFRKVSVEKHMEPLPDDCPKELAKQINACRAFDAFKRPSAGVLVDKLDKVVEQLEDE